MNFMDRSKTASTPERPFPENNVGRFGVEMFALENTCSNLSVPMQIGNSQGRHVPVFPARAR
jgi:hypothetical protein